MVTEANFELARRHGFDHDARVFHGDARQLVTLLPPEYAGQAALVMTSPLRSVDARQVAVAPGEGVQKYHHLYGNALDRGNIGQHRLLAGFTRILAALRTFLKPGGHIAITIQPWREHAELIAHEDVLVFRGRRTAPAAPPARNENPAVTDILRSEGPRPLRLGQDIVEAKSRGGWLVGART